jgi:hypothetical protein
MTPLRSLLALMTMGLAAAPSIAAAQSAATLRALLVEYRCPVVDRLERIHEAGDPASALDRFLAVTVPEHPHGYVQCMFREQRMRLLCEASSGFYFGKAGEPRRFYLSPEAIVSLNALGFDVDDSEGNFRANFDIAADPDFNAIADFILKALHDGYGARAESVLRFNAPFARRATSKCVPVS